MFLGNIDIGDEGIDILVSNLEDENYLNKLYFNSISVPCLLGINFGFEGIKSFYRGCLKKKFHNLSVLVLDGNETIRI